MFSEKDLKQLSEKGISRQSVHEQLENFKKGFPPIRLVAPATPGKGIFVLEEARVQELVSHYDTLSPDLDIVKFVPASGAATRMFKDLFAWRDLLKEGRKIADIIAADKQAATFFDNLEAFAFHDDLTAVMKDKGIDAQQCIEQKDYLPLLNMLLDDEGLGYAMLPKGLLRFHRYPDGNRTAMEEHLVEGANYARAETGKVKLHFTVSPEHRGRFVNHVGHVLEKWEKQFGVSFQVKFSTQKPSTDTLAVDMQNEPFREKDGSLLFRPGGHGALLQNLNDLEEDLVFIKNIDNVVPDRLRQQTYIYKKALGGLLIELREKSFEILSKINNNTFSESDYTEARSFATEQLCIDSRKLPDSFEQGTKALQILLNRPMRICGMVKNQGEPGGGPFWVESPGDGSHSLQIVESSQVNHEDKAQKEIFSQSTHFNPVDLVCSVKGFDGKLFDLTQFTDPQTGFISIKSKDGKDLKAQELPGLWNGAMAGWITVFVEVPLITFNPVKTIMDLLREEHR